MPSPFPGMDPYLEGELWTTFHSQMAPEIARQLTAKLAPRYVALTEKRYILEAPEEFEIAIAGRYPDVGIVKVGKERRRATGETFSAAPLEIATVLAEEVPHFWVEIRDTKKRKLVSVIEFLSPWNKREPGREEYLEKRTKLLHSSAHLMEIDLVRRGLRPPMRRALPKVPYFIFLSPVPRRPVTEIWPLRLKMPLPIVPVPLLPGDKDVPLDLQLAFTNVYDGCRYDLILDYQQPPDIALPSDAMAWMKKSLRLPRKT